MHLHSSEDDFERPVVHTWRDLIDRAAAQNYGVLAFTWHNHVKDSKEMFSYAKKRGILLVPACELTIEGCHTLLYGFSRKQIAKIRSFADLRREKKQDNLVVAPHPFFPISNALRGKLAENVDLFDAVEFTQTYSRLFNFNRAAVRFAKRFSKPLVGNSDCHNLRYLQSRTYTLVDSPKTVAGVIRAVKAGKVRLVTRPLSFFDACWTVISVGEPSISR